MRSVPGKALPTAMILISLAWLPMAVPGFTDGPEDGLVAYWPLDDVTDQVTPDATGLGNDAAVEAATLVKGVSNRAILFDGTASSVLCMDGRDMENASALTLEAWVKPASDRFPEFPTVIRRDGSYALRFYDNRLGFLLWFGEKVAALSSNKTDWEADRWYHVAATYNGLQTRMFIDGVLDAEQPVAEAVSINPGAVGSYIGARHGQHAFKGIIDEVRIYNRALDPTEVRASCDRGREIMAQQRDVTVEPQEVGEKPRVFRKPTREITMVQDGFLWIDAEDFTSYGGWLLDTQFVHLMGSAYLIAAGISKPVEDATVTVRIPRQGTYRLWVRGKNWLKEYSPGQFTVAIDGKTSERVFGTADSEDWIWQSAGDFTLNAGDTEISLRDLTGEYGRCDALILTTDTTYTPPVEMEAVRAERARLTGMSLAPRLVGDFDVIVVGAGSAGAPAAIAAARMGAKTALIQNRPVLGGNASSELGVGINGAASAHPNARESGIIEELGRIKARFGYMKMSEPFRVAAEQEPNLSVFVNQHVFAVQMADTAHIAAVQAVDTLANTVSVYRGKMFIDCTGDGWVGYYAGAEYRLGREPEAEFNESLAPEKPDTITMSGCLMGGRSVSYRAVDTGAPAPYTPPAWAPKFPADEDFARDPDGFSGGQWWLEHAGDIDDIWQAEKARDELLRISFGYWDFIKNTWSKRDQAVTYALSEVPIVEAKRESRRLIGDYILNQNDCQSGRVFPDAISHGGWPLDVHHPEGIYSGKEGPFDCDAHVPIYTVPYRCLYSKNIENLMFAGRDMSVTHIALGSVRVQGTLAAIGQAAGTAAAFALQEGITPRGIYQDRMAEFQQLLLKHDQYIPGLRNEDPGDLARTATVTTSSTAEFEDFGRDHVARDIIHPLNMPRAVMFPRGERENLGTVYLLLSSGNDGPVETTLHLREAGESKDFSSREDLLTVTATVPRGETWVPFPIDRDIQAPFVWVWLPETENVSWPLMSRAPAGSCRAYGGGQTGGWAVRQAEYYAFYTDPGIASRSRYSAESVTNGVTRIIADEPNMWASDQKEPLPQWIELDFGKRVDVNAVYLVFDTDMNAKYHTVPMVAECVRDYEVSCFDGDNWVTVAQVKGNFQRRRAHKFDTVAASKLRLTVLATNGADSAHVFEIRAYNE